MRRPTFDGCDYDERRFAGWRHQRSWRRRHPRFLRHRRAKALSSMLFRGAFAVILATALAVAGVFWLAAPEVSAWRRATEGTRAFVAHELARTWASPVERDERVRRAALDMGVPLVLSDAAGAVLVDARGARPCRHPFAIDVFDDRGARLGALEVCPPPTEHAALPIAIAAAILVVWVMTSIAARHMSVPFFVLADVARRIGEGDLRARPPARLIDRSVFEVRVLAEALAEMAARVEKQLQDERALLAGASHELRTPLGHVKLLLELHASAPEQERTRIEHDLKLEIDHLDRLLGQLLASSRLDFSVVDKQRVDAAQLLRRAIEQTGSAAEVVVRGDPVVQADATLLLALWKNLLENAEVHGGGAVRAVVERDGQQVRLLVEDEGPGVPDADRGRIFEPFYKAAKAKGAKVATAAGPPEGAAPVVIDDTSGAPKNGSLGIGLALVARIARAHGGAPLCENLTPKGCRIGALIDVGGERPAPLES